MKVIGDRWKKALWWAGSLTAVGLIAFGIVYLVKFERGQEFVDEFLNWKIFKETFWYVFTGLRITVTVALVSEVFILVAGLLVALVLFANNFRDTAYDSRHEVKTISILLGRAKSHHLFTLMIMAAYFYVVAMIAAGVISFWGLLIFLSLPQAIKLIKTFREKIPDMADALTAQFNMAFGVLLLIALFLENVVIY